MCASGIKYKLALSLLVSLAVFCGCAHQYLIKTSNGSQIISASKPKLQGTQYHFRDDTGMECAIPESRVVKIKAVSVVKEEPPQSPAKPKKPRHWYFLWLA